MLVKTIYGDQIVNLKLVQIVSKKNAPDEFWIVIRDTNEGEYKLVFKTIEERDLIFLSMSLLIQ